MSEVAEYTRTEFLRYDWLLDFSAHKLPPGCLLQLLHRFPKWRPSGHDYGQEGSTVHLTL